MRACGVNRPGGEVEMLELPEPPVPGTGQVLVAVQAAGMGPWDALLHTGGWDVGLRPPAALGVEGTGTILAVGADVHGVAVGDRVLAHEAPLPAGSGYYYVTANATQLEELGNLVAAGGLELNSAPVPLADAVNAFARVSVGATGGTKLVLTF